MELMIRTDHDPDVIPTWVGQFWLNTTNPKKLFVATALTGITDWIQINIATATGTLVYNETTMTYQPVTLVGPEDAAQFNVGPST